MKITNFKLGICLPLTSDRVHSTFLDSWVLLEKPEFVYIRPDFPGPIDKIRNNLVDQALRSGCTHILMMDTDQTYPKDTITKLITHDLDVVGAKVHRRYIPFDPLLLRKDPIVGKFYGVSDDEIEKGGLVEVDATGTGCILYKAEVFEKIENPWFEFSYNKEGKIVGEDIGFCNKLKEKEYRIFVDCSIDVGHSTNLIVNYDTYKLYKMLESFQQNNN